MTAQSVINDLEKLGNAKKAKASSWFFKTEKGQYGHGDKFFGVTVPEQRIVAKKFEGISLSDIASLLKSEMHECRLTAAIILTNQYKKANGDKKNKIVKFYIANAKRINNWDLVDSSAPYILGLHLLNKDKKILYKLAGSTNLWERRISIVATFAFIRESQYKDTLYISKILMTDKHDLIHKAVGWMLREVGKKSQKRLEGFLLKHLKTMPRTTLRYAIERFPEEERRKYLAK